MQNKVSFSCVVCSNPFERWPSAVRHAEERGTPIKYCSKECGGLGKTIGLSGAKKRHGEDLTCEVCSATFYRKQAYITNGRNRFCSEGCRKQAFKIKLIDKSLPRPANLRGEDISCCICGKTTYRKKSMIDRNINKTCGAKSCVSAYSRSLWNLPPRAPDLIDKPRNIRKARVTNFTSKQRAEWLGDHCAFCGTTKNLTLDHVVPVCAGGLSTKENSQTLCGRCNNIKGRTTDREIARRNATRASQ